MKTPAFTVHLLLIALALKSSLTWGFFSTVSKRFSHGLLSVVSGSPTDTKVFVPSLKNVPYRINQVVSKEKIDAVRFRHIELETEELAIQCRAMLVGVNSTDFSKLASTVSLCQLTKSNGGDTGWLNTTSSYQASPSASESMIPTELINAACFMNRGDISILSSRKFQKDIFGEEKVASSWHVLQLTDVNTAVNPSLLKRRRDNYKMIKGMNPTPSPDIQNKLKYSIETMGCQMNSADSERMEGSLKELGYTLADDSSTASVVILNTCSIRDHAEQKVYSYIGPHALRKRKGEDVSIIGDDNDYTDDNNDNNIEP
jgi:hypothetical protein